MKKVFALFLALLMVVSCMVILPVAAEEDTEIVPWDGKSTVPEGTGREKDPYIIDSAGDLAWLASFKADQRLGRLGRDGKYYYAQYATDALFSDFPIDTMNGTSGTTGFEGTYPKKYAAYHEPLVANDGSKMDWFDKIYVKQVCDIDMGGHSMTPIGNYWSNTQGAMGVKGCYFCGEYDGQGYTIKNGTFKNTGTNANWMSGSMFGVVWGATIKNINFENMTAFNGDSFTTDKNGVTTANNNSQTFGLVVGRAVTFDMFGSKENLAEYEKIENAKTVIDNVNVGNNCVLTCTAAKTGIGVGGIIGGMSNTTVKNCISAAVIRVENPKTTTTYADYARAVYTGGIVGVMYDDAWVENCLFAGHISYGVAIKAETHVGGIVGSWRGITTQTVNMGLTGIVDSVNLGSFSFAKSGSGTLCLGGILGATSCLHTNKTKSTYVFDNNANLSNSNNGATHGNARRQGSLVGCFYNNAAASENFNPNARYNQVILTNCFGVTTFGSRSPSTSYPLIQNLFTQREYGADQAEVGEGTIAYTRNLHFKALANEAIYPYVDANEEIAALDAAAVALYERNYDKVNEFLFGGAAGTAEDPYKVSSLAGLMWISAHTGSANKAASERGFRAAWAGKYFVQTADIDLLGTNIWSIGNYADRALGLVSTGLGSGDQVTSLENYRNLKLNAFGGNYNGQGYSIKNGNITDEANDNNNWASGLFGVIYGATIKNVTLDNVTHMANNNAGLLVGMSIAESYSSTAPYVANSATPVADEAYSDNFNVIDGCRVVNSTLTVGGADADASYGAIIGSAHSVTIRNCYTENVLLTENGDDRNFMAMGGIIGRVEAAVKVENCISGTNLVKKTGDAKNTNEAAFGGIIGLVNSQAYPAYPNATINATTGSYFSMKNCVNNGSFEVMGTKSGEAILYGGLIGSVNALYKTNKDSVVENCYNLNDSIIVPAGYNKINNFRVGGLVGCAWIADGADLATLNLVNCATVEGPAENANAYLGEDGLAATGRFTAFNQYARLTAAGKLPLVAVNSSEVPMIAKTEKELDTLEALVADVLDELTLGTNGAKGIGAAAEIDDRDRLNLTFYGAIDADVKKADIKNVVFNITLVNEEGEPTNYTMDYAGYTTDVTAPAGYDLVAEYTLPLGKRADECFIVSYSVTIEMADGSVVSAFATNFLLMYGEVVVD